MANRTQHLSRVQLDGLLDTLRRREDLVDTHAAKDVANAFMGLVRENVAANQDPYGHAWHPPPDGQPVLVHAADKVECTVEGTSITMTVSGVERMHQVGSAKGYHGGSSAKGGFRRPIIPWSNLPGPFKAVARKVLENVLLRKFGAL
jgi:hypothetical protein